MSDRIAVMHDGNLLQVGRPEEIYHEPNCRFVADFIGEANLIPGSALGRDPGLTIAIRPERVTLDLSQGHRTGKARGSVAAVTFLGLDTLVEVDLPGEIGIRARLRDVAGDFTPGDAVDIDWAPEAERELRH
jgi:spermidine/putrescine transport system ATP-binding protein